MNKLSLYSCSRYGHKKHIIASSKDEASEIFTQLTGLKEPAILVKIDQEEILVSEQAKKLLVSSQQANLEADLRHRIAQMKIESED